MTAALRRASGSTAAPRSRRCGLFRERYWAAGGRRRRRCSRWPSSSSAAGSSTGTRRRSPAATGSRRTTARAPVPLDAVLRHARRRRCPRARRVDARSGSGGATTPASTLLVRNRPLDGAVRLRGRRPAARCPTARCSLVDRGWIPFGESATRLPDAVPAPPAGPGRGRRPAAARSSRRWPLPAARAGSADRPAARSPPRSPGTAATGPTASSPRSSPGRRPPPPRCCPGPTPDLGPHLAYAVQWWGFAVAAYVLLGYYALPRGAEPPARRPGRRPRRAAAAARRARARRRTVRDEDVEDAALDR